MAAVAATPGAKASAATPVRSHNEPAMTGRTKRCRVLHREDRGAHAVHVAGRGEPWREGERDDERERRGEAEHERPRDHARAWRQDDAQLPERHQRSRADEADASGQQPLPKRDRGRGEQLGSVEDEERWGDEGVAAGLVQEVRDVRIRPEVDGRRHAHDESDAHGRALSPVGPPSRGHGRSRATPGRCENDGDAAHDDDHRPHRDRPSPVSVGQGQHADRGGQAGWHRLADEDPVAVDRGGDCNPAREPFADQGGKRRLAHRHPDAHEEGRREQDCRAGSKSAEPTEDRNAAETHRQRATHTELGDEQRSRHGGRGEQQDRQ